MRFITALFMLFIMSVSQASQQKQIYGYVEKVRLQNHDLSLSAKLDTGAKSASLSAIDIQKVKIDGVEYISFNVPQKKGPPISIQAKLLGEVKIKVRAGEIKSKIFKRFTVARPVVLLRVKLGEKIRNIEVNLANRKRFNYPMLLGRDAINEFDGIIDPALKFTVKTIKPGKTL